MTAGERARLVGWSAVHLVGGFVVAGGVVLPLAPWLLISPPGPLQLAAVQGTALLAGFGLLSWLVGGKVLGFSRRDFERLEEGPDLSRRVGRFGWGALAGASLAAVALLGSVLLGQASWRGDGGTPAAWLGRLGVTAAVLLPAALAEELAFRGVPLLAVSRAVGRMPATVGLAVLFALAHLRNPEVTALGLLNIGLAGLFLGLVFFTAGGLWASTGAHLGWNLTLAGLGAPVSGLPLPMPGLDYSPGGPDWLTGGSFGPEGGALASLCLAGGSLAVRRRLRRKEGASS